MSCISKSNELREIVYDRIIPLLSDKAILADAPYYNNIGDVLIWQGITDFLKENSIRLLKTTSYNTFTFPELSDERRKLRGFVAVVSGVQVESNRVLSQQ